MNISILLKSWRYAEKLGVREAAKIVGLSISTFNRVERGEAMEGETLATILQWALRPKPTVE